MSERSVKIMAVDDENDILMLLSNHLQQAGYRVITAENGPAALAKAIQELPDLTILDRRMPLMDGLEVCHKLRQQQPDMYIIMLSGLVSEEDRIAGLEAGADDYICKPFSTKELILKVQAMLRRSRQLISPSRLTDNPPTQDQSAPLSVASISNSVSLPGPAPAPPLEQSNSLSEHEHIQRTRTKNLEAILRKASEAAQAQEISYARGQYHNALNLDPYNETALMWLAWYATDPYEGCSYLERLVAAHPENSKAVEFLEAGRKRIKELDALISDSNVLSTWQVNPGRTRQQEPTKFDPVVNNPSTIIPIGQLLLKKGFISREQLDSAVNLHEMFSRLDTPKKLGEILLEYGYLSKEQLKNVLAEQAAYYNQQFQR